MHERCDKISEGTRQSSQHTCLESADTIRQIAKEYGAQYGANEEERLTYGQFVGIIADPFQLCTIDRDASVIGETRKSVAYF